MSGFRINEREAYVSFRGLYVQPNSEKFGTQNTRVNSTETTRRDSFVTRYTSAILSTKEKNVPP